MFKIGDRFKFPGTNLVGIVSGWNEHSGYLHVRIEKDDGRTVAPSLTKATASADDHHIAAASRWISTILRQGEKDDTR